MYKRQGIEGAVKGSGAHGNVGPGQRIKAHSLRKGAVGPICALLGPVVVGLKIDRLVPVGVGRCV